MPKETWIIASVLTAVLLLGLLGLASWEKKREVEKVRAELAEAQAAATKAQAEADDLKGKLADSEARNQDLQKQQDIVVHTHQSLEDEMRNALESKDVTISQLQGKLTVNILDRVMFDSGEADLKPAGAAVLRKVAGVLAQHPNIKVHVIGHTDNVPITYSGWKSNWELGSGRALSVLHYMIDVQKFESTSMSATTFGEFKPTKPNDSAENKQMNRRAVVVVQVQ